MRKATSAVVLLLLGGAPTACREDVESPQAACNLADPVGSCANGQSCESVGGKPTCVAPFVVRGRVVDPAGAGIVGAVVAGMDVNDAPVTGTARSGANGAFELRVLVARDDAGMPVTAPLKLRAAAAGFDPFPSGLRRSLPLDVSALVSSEGKLVHQSAATNVLLTPLADAQGLGSVSGKITAASGRGGVLVVAEGPRVGTAVSDFDGNYVIFNLAPGSYDVRGYAAGLQLAATTATVVAGNATVDRDLHGREAPVGRVSGSVNIVDAPGGAKTSVVLVVESTFNDTLARGEVPRGLRSPGIGPPDISGAFSIAGVPDGRYVVLAAFENDGLVRDPDTSIGGTQIQRITVGEGGRDVTLPTSFKITEALAVMRPSAGDSPEVMSAAPTFVWKDDSSEDRYELEVFDGMGRLVWKHGVPKQTGGEVTAAYAGPALTPGWLYQFRVTSIRRETAISQSEDGKGVFLVQP